jgi:hypothetical protein
MRALISWSTAERNLIPQNGQYAIAPEASLSMMVCGRFYSLRVESPSGYDILSTAHQNKVTNLTFVTPAEAGVQVLSGPLGSGFRRNDEQELSSISDTYL